ncbi:unnamed protein product [Amoebophrya sp. A25]|nr:unnamed protein product [Amoebophrya sp. A25]|eukprot:GSA25T00022969001.1
MNRFLKSCAMLAVSAGGVKIATTAAEAGKTVERLNEKIQEVNDNLVKIQETKCSQVDRALFSAACGDTKPTDDTITREIVNNVVTSRAGGQAKLENEFDEANASGDVKKLVVHLKKDLKYKKSRNNEVVHAACCPDFYYNGNACCR